MNGLSLDILKRQWDKNSVLILSKINIVAGNVCRLKHSPLNGCVDLWFSAQVCS